MLPGLDPTVPLHRLLPLCHCLGPFCAKSSSASFHSCQRVLSWEFLDFARCPETSQCQDLGTASAGLEQRSPSQAYPSFEGLTLIAGCRTCKGFLLGQRSTDSRLGWTFFDSWCSCREECIGPHSASSQTHSWHSWSSPPSQTDWQLPPIYPPAENLNGLS